MRNAYALLGLSFLIVFVGAYFVIEHANAPIVGDPILGTSEGTEANDGIIEEEIMLTLTTPAFSDGELIPSKYTCDGENVNPALHISGVPEGTQSLVLVMDDPDIPQSVKDDLGIEKFDHWVLYNIPPDTTLINENSSVGAEGLTSRGGTGFVGSCPPDREHRYIYRLYALPSPVDFLIVPTLGQVESAAKGNALESATLMGRYERTSN